MKHSIRIGAILLLTVVLLALFLRNSDLDQVWGLIRDLHPGWFILALTCNFCALLCRAERWRTVLRPDDPPPYYATFFATSLGFMSSAILPIRAGDVVRPALLSRRTDIRFSSALGTVVIERMFDVIAILSLFTLFVLRSLGGMESHGTAQLVFIRTAGMIAGALLVTILAAAVAIYFFHATVRRFHRQVLRIIPRRFASSWMNLFDSFVRALSIVHHRRAFIRVVALTSCIWLFLCSQFYFVMIAMGHPLPFSASFFVTGMVIIGFAIPTPGGVGGFHKVCRIVLTTFYGLTVDVAVAVALVFHVVGTAPVILTGLTLLLREGVSFNQLARIGENPEE